MGAFVAGDRMVDDEQLKNVITSIDDNRKDEIKFASLVCEQLDNLKQDVSVNNHKFDNKRSDAEKSMNNFRANHDAIVQVYYHLIGMYKASKTHSANIVKKKRGEI